jgi:circadian clock protein KaiB
MSEQVMHAELGRVRSAAGASFRSDQSGASKLSAVSHAKPSGGRLSTYLLKLYVTGTSPRAEVAIANLRRICEQELRGEYQLEIIDVLEHPQVAEDDKILATPTLIKQLPPPLRRVIGDLSDKTKVLLGLEVRRDATNSDPHRDQS